MKFSDLALALVPVSQAVAQVFAPYTDDNGIDFWQATWDPEVTGELGKAQWGMALPPASATDLATEYIGRLVVPKLKSDDTWMGLTHQSGMTGSLLLVTWPNGDDVEHSFRYASGYVAPEIYKGNATLYVISQDSNDTHYSLTYRCENCWSWEQDGSPGSQIPATTASAAQVLGWAQATTGPSVPSNPKAKIQQHYNDGLFGAAVGSARNSAYTKWANLATTTTGTPTTSTAVSSSSIGVAHSASSGAIPTPKTCSNHNPATEQTYDYIVVGAGAGGIPMADKLSETGASVLLIERGPPSSGRWGGTMKPKWLVGTNLTRFDVPGLDNEIWVDSAGIACPDVGVMSGCVLGGGTAVNAGLWWKANPEDFDYNFPDGWKSSDMQDAIARTFERIPGTERPSTDGILYKPEGYNIVGGALAASGWKNVTANSVPDEKNMTFSHPEEMFSHGERGGPMATYLLTASKRSNFQLITNTTVNRLVRNGGAIAGVQIQAFTKGGQCGTVRLNDGGKVILSAGAFGTPKILFRSGIGPQDQLEIVQKAEPKEMPGGWQWINLPVGYNLDDHVNTDIVITHPNVSFYDFYGAYNNPITADANSYLNHRTGILTQSAPNLAAMAWQEITGADGVTRQIQWNARVEGGHGITSKNAMTISQYLGRGATSRGRTTINSGLNMVVSTVPYLHDKDDVAAVQSGIEMLFKSLASDPKITVVYPPAKQSISDFLANYPLTTGSRSANHWMGSCQMSTDSGLKGGVGVVDTNAKVYGTDNLFIVDASIFPGMVSTNPSALIVAAAEHASELILNYVPPPVASSSSSSASVAPATSSSAPPPPKTSTTTSKATPTTTTTPSPTTSTTSKASPTTTSTTTPSPTTSTTSIKSPTTTTPSPTTSTTSKTSPTTTTKAPDTTTTSKATPTTATTTASGGSGGAPIAAYQRCGGIGYTGNTKCVSAYTCKVWNDYYSQCVPS